MKRCLLITAVVLAACSNSPAAGPSDVDRASFCNPVTAAYEQIDPSDIATVRAVVVSISENASVLDEINRATFVAYGAELQVTLTAGIWSTAKLANELNTLCDVDLPIWTSP
ncbi:MAG: hypothetical protein JJE47_05810 [Acidimicrobiia bacterium]|nr:hypothetical protein [Acidimicrobiia bacterium]